MEIHGQGMGCRINETERKMKIGALIVLYHPDREMTEKVVGCLLRQVEEVCIVDNSDQNNKALFDQTDGKTHYIFMGGNKGIAAAQNRGISHFVECGFDYLISCDQDTLIDDDTIARLLQTMTDLQQEGIKVAAVAPIGIDHYSHQPITYNIAKIGKTRIAGHDLLEVTHTMNSMSLIPVPLFKEIGGMEEDLFIDAVDCEWCWRARHKAGARSFYDTHIFMEHTLGIATKKVAGKRAIHITPAFRMYYQYRNYLWLLHRRYTPKRWVAGNGIKYIVKFFYYTIISPGRRSYFRQITKGVKDGLKGKQQ